jgi:F0F1-type ATP synthase membrane subunit c/vacuolar-type H+-ATPase subunit K
LALVLPALAWVAPAQAWASQGQFANLIFGFAVTEALGIFSLLIALLLLFAL